MSKRVVHFELLGADGERLKTFYRAAFGWSIEDAPGMGDYGLVDTGAGSDKGQPNAGINGGVGTSEHGAMTVLYVQCDDIDAQLEIVRANGGEVLMPRSDIGPVVMAQFRDPAGNVVGLVESDSGGRSGAQG